MTRWILFEADIRLSFEVANECISCSSNYTALLYAHSLQNIKWLRRPIVLDSQIQITEENQTHICTDSPTPPPPPTPQHPSRAKQKENRFTRQAQLLVNTQNNGLRNNTKGGKHKDKQRRKTNPLGALGANGRGLNIARRRWPA